MKVFLKKHYIIPLLLVLVFALLIMFFFFVDFKSKDNNIKADSLYKLGCRGNVTIQARDKDKSILLQTVININQLKSNRAIIGMYGTISVADEMGNTIKRLNLFRSVCVDFELSNASQSIYSIHNQRIDVEQLDNIDANISLASLPLSPLVYKQNTSEFIKIQFIWPNAILISDLFTPIFVCTINDAPPVTSASHHFG